jgi:hypothetical protein
MDIQLSLLFTIAVTCIASVFITGLFMNKRHRKKINQLEKELLELNWYLLNIDNRKDKYK